jgi:hypothetical protein
VGEGQHVVALLVSDGRSGQAEHADDFFRRQSLFAGLDEVCVSRARPPP